MSTKPGQLHYAEALRIWTEVANRPMSLTFDNKAPIASDVLINVSLLYMKGTGVPQDLDKALDLAQKAAAVSNPDAKDLTRESQTE